MHKVLDLFSGIGGFSVGLEGTGKFETVAFCEIESYPRAVINKHWPGVPCHLDVTKLKGEDVGTVDIITGGFPCQDLSSAGQMRGIGEGTRSGLFREMLRLAEACGRPFILFENVSWILSGPAENKGNGLTTFSGPWPKSGMMQSGFAYPLPALERRTSENVSGLLPTPMKHNSKEGAYPAEYTRNTPTLATHAGGKINPEWSEHLMGFPHKWTDLGV